MRIEPEEESMLDVSLRVCRFMCNWFWPTMLLAASMALATIVTGEGLSALDWVWAAVYYPTAIWLWRKNLGRLRELRRLHREIHQ